MTGTTVVSPPQRYLEWITGEAVVLVRSPSTSAGKARHAGVYGSLGRGARGGVQPDGARVATGGGTARRGCSMRPPGRNWPAQP